ncbi:MAG: SDR family NAD(P)-dependent oxidoreductase [Bacteroidia bacterium]
MKHIAIFGGTGGLGSKLAEELAGSFKVTALGSKDVDVTDYSQVRAFFEEQTVDIVLNFSGTNIDGFMHKYNSENQSNIDVQINTNIRGTINILSCCLGQMRERGYGRIVLVSSILAHSPVVGTGVYSGCKGFIDSIVKTVALENAAKGITCNSLQLGYFDGGLTYRIPEEVREGIVKSIPAGRLGMIRELANVTRMLIDTEYMNGVNLKVNGGLDIFKEM